MKKILMVIIAIVSLVTLAGCTQEPAQELTLSNPNETVIVEDIIVEDILVEEYI